MKGVGKLLLKVMPPNGKGFWGNYEATSVFLSTLKKVSWPCVSDFFHNIGFFLVLSKVLIRGIDYTEYCTVYLLGVCGMNHENTDIFVCEIVKCSFNWVS